MIEQKHEKPKREDFNITKLIKTKIIEKQNMVGSQSLKHVRLIFTILIVSARDQID